MLTIKNFRKRINPVIMERGEDYFNRRKVCEVNSTKPGLYSAKVKGRKIYEVLVEIDSEGNIKNTACTCPYMYGVICKHIAAVLLSLEDNVEDEISALSSTETQSLIKTYESAASETYEKLNNEEKVHIVPLLYKNESSGISFEFKIGRTRLYKVRDIFQLYKDFLNKTKKSYGKELCFTHDFNVLDDKSKQLMRIISELISQRGYYNYNNSRPSEMIFDTFFEIFRDDTVSFEDEQYTIKFEDPRPTLRIMSDKNKRFKIFPDNSLIYLGKGSRACFANPKDKTLMITSVEFAKNVCELYSLLQSKGKLYISNDDMTAFYTAVIRKVSEYANIKGETLINDYIPPEMTPQLYVDCGEDNVIFGNLMFAYGDETFPAFKKEIESPHYDKFGEKSAQNIVLHYFTQVPGDDHHPLIISCDEDAYRLISIGLPELAKTMELYVSDRFRRMAVRPPIKTQVGVRPNGGLLELEIEDENYSRMELLEVLKAYRTGAKYHRLKDGSFAIIDNSISQLNELVSNLNVSAKDIIKEKIKIPAYRMLYLDNLKSSGNLHVSRSAEFKKAANEYHAALNDADSLCVPESLSDIMRDYQKYGFRWLKTLTTYKFGGILADDMGLGKTVQAISVMLDYKQRSKTPGTNFIVCPSSLTLNWESEIAKFAPELKTLTVIGTAAVRNRLIEKIKTEEYDAVITSYALLTRDIEKYEDIRFNIHFIDEAQYIKNHNTQASKAVKSIKSEAKFALTGTPVENSLAELWSIFDFIMPGYLFSYNHFKKNFETPIVSNKDKQSIEALQKNTAPFILRRLKKDVLSELPDKTETILTADMEGEQHKLYTAAATKIKKILKDGSDDNQKKRIEILSMLTRLRQICCDPHLAYENYTGGSSKLEQCMELIESCVNSGHKILLFSQFTSMLDIIAKRLSSANISYYTLTGSTKAKERIKLVNEFNENNVNVFLISLKAGGTGLNLTGADIVIHYDPWWNSSAENQASDRAYRIGQKHNVQVYKLIAHKSIEENIIKLQQSKADLNDIAAGGSADITRMSTDEIIKILE